MLSQVPGDSWWAYVFSSGSLRNITLWGTSLVCAALAWLGACLFFYVLLSRYFLPETSHYSRSLYFDYTKADAVATAHFLPDTQYHQARSSQVLVSVLAYYRYITHSWRSTLQPELLHAGGSFSGKVLVF